MPHPDAALTGSAAHSRHDAILRQLLIDAPTIRALLLATLPAAAIAASLLIAPMQVYSREMTWDLLFNLDGAWRIYNGQLPNVDFHTELGALPFALTALGFYLVGPSVMGFVVGQCIFAAIVLVLACAAVLERLPLVPAALFTVLCTFIALMPTNYGDLAGAYSFAMAYNRFGWSISAILLVQLFVEPLEAQRSAWKDCCVGLAALLLLYYVKITYFAVGFAALALALFVPGHVRTNRRWWFAVIAVAALGVIAPYNLHYLQDILNQALAGGVRTNIVGYVGRFASDPTEYSAALAGCLALTAASSRGHVRSQAVVGAWFLTAAGFLLVSQNMQYQGIPIYAVIGLLLYGAVRDLAIRQEWSLDRREVCLLLAPLVFPLLLAGASGLSLSRYWYKQVKMADEISVVPETNLNGLAVPLDDLRAFASFTHKDWSPDLFSRIRSVTPRYELSQLEYVTTIVDLSSLLRNETSPAGRPPRIMIIDRVNPLPFMLGLPPPRGVDLWWGEEWDEGLIHRPGDAVFADADFVAIPLFPTRRRTTDSLMDYYRTYLAAHFRTWRETSEWIVLRRADAIVQ
jgi:hypothetical protein